MANRNRMRGVEVVRRKLPVRDEKIKKNHRKYDGLSRNREKSAEINDLFREEGCKTTPRMAF